MRKFSAVIYSLIKGGVRYCSPSSISDLYRTLAVPTLTYGLELCSVTQRQLEDLDREGRKAIKQLFSISKHSRNYLHNLLFLTPISTTINNNKLNLLTRLMQHTATKSVVLSILSLPEGPPPTSFVHNVLDLMKNVGKNFYELLICQNTLQDCLRNWNVGEKRKEFKTIMEEHVPARPVV